VIDGNGIDSASIAQIWHVKQPRMLIMTSQWPVKGDMLKTVITGTVVPVPIYNKKA